MGTNEHKNMESNMNPPNKQAELEKELIFNVRACKNNNLSKKDKDGHFCNLCDIPNDIIRAELKGIKEGKAQALSEFIRFVKDNPKAILHEADFQSGEIEFSITGELITLENLQALADDFMKSQEMK